MYTPRPCSSWSCELELLRAKPPEWAKASLSSCSQARLKWSTFVVSPPRCAGHWVWTGSTRKDWGGSGQESGLLLLLWVSQEEWRKGGRGLALGLCALHVSPLSRPQAVNHSRDTGRQRLAGGEEEEEREGRSFMRTLVMHSPPPSTRLLVWGLSNTRVMNRAAILIILFAA